MEVKNSCLTRKREERDEARKNMKSDTKRLSELVCCGFDLFLSTINLIGQFGKLSMQYYGIIKC